MYEKTKSELSEYVSVYCYYMVKKVNYPVLIYW